MLLQSLRIALVVLLAIFVGACSADLECACNGFEKMSCFEDATNTTAAGANGCRANGSIVVSEDIRRWVVAGQWIPSCVLLERIKKGGHTAQQHQQAHTRRQFSTCYYCPKPAETPAAATCNVIERKHDTLRVACCWDNRCNGRSFDQLCPSPQVLYADGKRGSRSGSRSSTTAAPLPSSGSSNEPDPVAVATSIERSMTDQPASKLRHRRKRRRQFK